MPASTVKTAYWRGVAIGAPFILVIVPFAMVFGVIARESGLSLVQTVAFSGLVIAGASQFTALQLMVDSAPIAAVLAAALAVNLRMAMYSAALVPWLGSAPFWQRMVISYLNVDQTYAASIPEYERRPEMTVSERVAYFAGIATPIFPLWYGFTWVGAVAGSAFPDGLGLDFVMPIMFIALVAPLVRTVAHAAAVAVSAVSALAFAGLPAGTGLLLAAALAMATGALVETAQERRRAATDRRRQA
ncbi:branched-chain amino acid ABC transporter permease [Mesobaculum littorinae]|uniref:Branched-chain amino acid ABC transporter permease n=1 Tax=Mesobaculum littorinae TaxID=2486419 RepID=A0A438AGR4_9RHOB|nr:AzlC family ABC transporter permease [Mesobaculum littorinae]RVV97815.1 branched-chain amino acid ABC transporter permease [Mesobaculum littorinae]